MFAALTALIAGGGLVIAVEWPRSFSAGAWYTGAILLVFAAIGRAIVRRERHASGT